MAKGSGGESNVALISFLVLFILISLAEGGVIYSFSQDKAQAVEDLKKEQAEKKKVEADVEWYRHLYLRCKNYLGEPLLDKEKDAHDKLCEYWENKKLNPRDKELKDPTVALIKTLDDKTKFDGVVAKKAAADYPKQLEDAKADKAKAEGAAKAAQAREDEARANEAAKKAEYAQVLQEADDKVKKVEALLNAEKTAFNALKADVPRQLDAASKKMKDDLQQELAKVRELEVAVQDKDKKVTDLEKRLEAMQVKLDKDKTSKAPQVKLTQDKTKMAQITQLDRTGKWPYINLGSADKVKPLSTLR